MLSTGVVRSIDELGRIVVPVEIRRMLNIFERDAVEIFLDGEKIILKRYFPKMCCRITGEVSDDNLQLADGKLIVSREAARQLSKEIKEKL